MDKRINNAAYQEFIQALVGIAMDINGMCTLYELARMRGDVLAYTDRFHTKLVQLEEKLHAANAMQLVEEEKIQDG